MALKPGDKAPDFTLPADDGRPMRLRDFKGKKVILYFYPKDLTPGCTTEACDFRDATPELTERGAMVLGVSRDAAALHQKFKAKHELPFPLLTDADGAVMQAYGAWGEKTLYGKKSIGVIRTTVLIGEDGRIMRIWPKVRVQGHAAEVLEAAAAAGG